MAAQEKRTSGSEHVKEIIAKTKNFSLVNSTANIQVFSYLSSLADFLQDQEQEFYNKIGVHDIRELNALLSTLSFKNNLLYLNAGGSIYNYINDNFIFSDEKNNLNQQVENNIFDLFNEALSQIDANKFLERYENESSTFGIYDAAMDALTSIFDGFRVDGQFLKLVFTARGKTSATNYYKKDKSQIGESTIKLNLNTAIPRFGVQVIEDHFVISGNPDQFIKSVNEVVKNFVRPELMKKLNKTYQGKIPLKDMSNEILYDTINDIIQHKYNIYMDADDLIACRKIAINGSRGGISGYLGELQARLTFKSLFQNVKNTEIIDAGASYIKGLSGDAQQNPADMIIKVANEIFNIQVKNYSKGNAEWGGASKIMSPNGEEVRDVSSAESFLKDRLQINNTTLMEYFGAVTWHNLNPDYSDNPFYDDYIGIYQSLISIFKSLKESFDTFIPNIIRLVAIVSGVSGLQYENFYFSKGRMIPASAIINGIIDALSNTTSRKIYNSSYSMHPGVSHYTAQIPYINNYSSYAKETSISWRVSINFNSVLSSLGL